MFVVIFAGRGRPRKKVIYEEIDDRTSESDTDITDSQYSGSTVVNSPMSLSTEAEDFEIQINDDDDSDIEVSFVLNALRAKCCPHYTDDTVNLMCFVELNIITLILTSKFVTVASLV